MRRSRDDPRAAPNAEMQESRRFSQGKRGSIASWFSRQLRRRPMTGSAKPPFARPGFIIAALLAGGLSGLEYARYRRDIEQARVNVSMGSRIAETACGPIEYGTAGEGPAVLLVHGAGGGFDQGLEFGQPLAVGLHIIAMSRFGYLRTPLPAEASAAAQGDAHACLLDALKVRRAAIVGASAGAPSALQFALRHPQRCSALVLLVPAVYVPRAGNEPSLRTPAATRFLFETALRSDFLLWAATRYARPAMIQAILATPLKVVRAATADEQARVGKILTRVLPVSARRIGLLNDAAVISSLQRYELEHISVPTLVIGVADCLFGTFEPARYTAQHIPGARLKAFSEGGHLWVGHEREVIAEIAAFLNQRRD